MKYAVILPDGAADEPVPELAEQTPLEAARKPNIDWIAVHGRQGRVVTVPDGFSPGSDVATLSLFGYDPRTDHTGRAPLEAAAKGIACSSNEIIFRCNFVTIVDGMMSDFTAGHISQTEADRLIADLNDRLGDSGCRFHAGVSYRNLLVALGMPEGGLLCTPPHDIPDQPVADHRPRGSAADWVRRVTERAHEILADHEVNQVRRDLGENPATDIWLWGQGRPKALQPFAERFGVSGAVIAAVDLIRGIARSAGMSLIDVPGATGYLDTDYRAKGRAAVAAMKEYDLVIVHIEAPDEAGHLGDARAKVTALERIDEHIVGPLLEALRVHDSWRILVAPDHPTPVTRRVHTSEPPPYCMAGSGIDNDVARTFSESNATQTSGAIAGFELMPTFLRGSSSRRSEPR